MTDPVFEVVPARGNTIRLIGELDLESVPMLADALAEMPDDKGMTLDLSELSFIDSAGLHALLKVAGTRDGRGPLTLAKPSEHVARVFEIVGLDRHGDVRIRR